MRQAFQRIVAASGLFLFASAMKLAHAQTAAAPDLDLRGTITSADMQTYREVPFTVPAGVTRITVDFSYTERDKKTSIDLGLLDAERFRGWSGGNKSTFTLSETDATPSYRLCCKVLGAAREWAKADGSDHVGFQGSSV